MYRLLLILILVSFNSSVLATELIRYPHAQGSLENRHRWAHDAAAKRKTYWIGYGVMKLMDPGSVFMSGVSISDFQMNKEKLSLQEWIYGIKPERPQDEKQAAKAELDQYENSEKSKIWKEVGIFQKFRTGTGIPERVQLITLSMPSTFDAPLYWLGKASHEESFHYMSGLYRRISGAENKEDVMAAIGIHPPAMAFPFLKNVLNSNQEPVEAQEAAAIFMGEVESPEALYLLQQVAESNPHEDVREAAVVGIGEIRTDAALQILMNIAKNHRDPELRETAMAMLSDKDHEKATRTLEEIAWFDADEDIRETAVAMLGETEAGVPALLRIMEEHPSENTRETAIYILAETVAGRKILKEKIKQ